MTQKILSNTINLDLIRNIPLFSGLSETEKDALLKEGSIYFYPRKSILFRREDPSAYFYVIYNGIVRLFHETTDGHEITTHIRIAGDTICTTGIFSPDTVHKTHAMAVSDVTTIEFPAEWIKNAARNYGAIASNILTALSQRSRQLKQEAENQRMMTASQQVACFLKRICALYGFDPRGFDLPYSKSLIASRLGLSQETLSRTFVALQELGVTVKGKHVIIRDIQSLEQNVCGHCTAAEPAVSGCDKKNCSVYKCGIEEKRGIVISFPKNLRFLDPQQAAPPAKNPFAVHDKIRNA